MVGTSVKFKMWDGKEKLRILSLIYSVRMTHIFLNLFSNSRPDLDKEVKEKKIK